MRLLPWAKKNNEEVRWFAGRSDIGDYMHRWLIQTPFGTLRLHHILRSDEARAMHDHPWAFWSVLLTGGYTEITPGGTLKWPRYSLVIKEAADKHRLILDEGPIWTLVWSGPRIRKWGFDIPGRGWTYWRDAQAFWSGQ